MHTYTHTHIYIYIHIYTHVYIYIYRYVYVCIVVLFQCHVGTWGTESSKTRRPPASAWVQAGREFEAAGCFKDAAECAEVSRSKAMRN